jgi:hypothetical protein
MTGLLDWIFVAANLLGGGAWIFFRRKKHPSPVFVWLYLALYLFHLAMGLYFFDHVKTYGGDSLFYWELPWYFDREYSEWWRNYGYGNYFIQSFNAPLVWSGVGYLGGTFLYNFLSFLGIGLIYEKAIALFTSSGEETIFPLLLSFAVCCSPGLHFWTGGISKEALLILALGLVFFSSERGGWRFLLLGFLGFFLALQVRLITGLLLAAPYVWGLLVTRKIPRVAQVMVTLVTALLCFRGVKFMQVLVDTDELSMHSIDRISTYQLQQLGQLQAKSQIPFDEMSLPERVLAVLFRPFPWEVWDLNSFVFTLENASLLILMLIGLFFIFKERLRLPRQVLGLFGLGIGMVLIYAFTLNNFGIIYRMKSIFLPFLLLPFIWVIYEKWIVREKFIN